MMNNDALQTAALAVGAILILGGFLALLVPPLPPPPRRGRRAPRTPPPPIEERVSPPQPLGVRLSPATRALLFPPAYVLNYPHLQQAYREGDLGAKVPADLLFELDAHVLEHGAADYCAQPHPTGDPVLFEYSHSTDRGHYFNFTEVA